MQTPENVQTITPQALSQWTQTDLALILIDTLTDDHFTKMHLPGAHSACVFQVTFLDQIRAITADRQSPIVIYGASDTSMEAAVAAEKLLREGYTRLYILEGGIKGWQSAGFSLEGEAADTAPVPENRLELNDGNYHVDIDQSIIEWAGRNPNTKHDGTIAIAAGTITVAHGQPTGSFTIDMNAIENRSLAGDELQPVLIDHLKSDDFFFTRLFPTATFIIQEATLRDDAHLSAPNMDLKGELTLRGITAGLDFPATIVQAPDQTITARAQVDLDRTHWNIIYGSTRFFEHLGMHLVFDHISADIKIVARMVD